MPTIAIVSDAHTNSRVGLFHPFFGDDDGNTHSQNILQRWLWECWLDYWQAVKDNLDGELYVVLNGDLVDGDHHGTAQIITKSTADQAKIAIDCLSPMLDLNPAHIFIIRGTEVHVGASAQDEETIAWFLSNKANVEPEPETGNYSWWFLPLEVGGVGFDIAHHGRGGYRPWTRANAAQLYAAELTFDYFGAEWVPKVAIRSHVHYKADSGDNFPIRVLYTPPWQQSTAYGHRVKAGKRQLKAGGLIFNCKDGEYSLIKKMYDPPPDKVWRDDNANNRVGALSGIRETVAGIWKRDK